MSNSQITSQLTRVTVPSVSDGKFVEGIGKAFETINNNFKTIASLPFIQGVQGDSYTLISKDIWVEVNDNISPVHYALTKEGAVLLNSIFESALVDNTGDTDTKKFQEGDSFDECKTNILGELSLNGVSPIDSFFTEEIEEDKLVKKLVNNKLYFYSIINNLNEEQDTYLGQYFYFIDARITELGNIYSSKGLSEFNDFTGFYQYQPASDTEPERYNVISIVPNLYYDKYKDDICWKYNGQETGISAIGPKGLDGKDSNFVIIFVSNTSETANSGNILGYYDFNANGGLGGIIYDNTIKDCFCLIQFVSTTVENGITEITEYIDSAFGEVHSNKAYWEDEYRISKLFNNQNITRYFCSMGDPSSIENNPSYFSIPSDRDRSNSSETTYQYGHVLLSSEEGDLVLQKSTNAFTANGQQEEALELYTIKESNFNIRNYNVNIGDSDIGVGGNLNVLGSATIESLDVPGSASIGSLDVEVGVDISGTLSVSGSATIGGSGGLGVNWDVNIGKDLTVDGNATIGGVLDASYLDVSNDSYIGNLHVTDSASIGSDLDVTNSATIGGELFVTKKATIERAQITEYLDVFGGLQATTKKPNNIDMIGGTPDTTDGKSNVLFGHNNPGNSGLPDFPLNIENAGYPLVIKSLKRDGNEDPGYMIFGPADIYAVKKGTVNSKNAIIPNTLCLQDRNNYFGDVIIGRNLKIGDYTDSGGTGGNLIIQAPFDTSGNANKAIIIRKSNEDPSDYNLGTDKLTIFSNGNIVTAGDLSTTGSATIGSYLVVNDCTRIKGPLYVEDNNASIGGALSTTGSATIGSYLVVNDCTRIKGPLYVDNNNATIGGDLEVTNSATIGGALFADKAIIDGSLNVSGGAKITGISYNYDTNTNYPGLVVYGGSGGKHSAQPGGTGLVVYGGKVLVSEGSATYQNSLGLKVATGGAEISDNLSVGQKLFVNRGATGEGASNNPYSASAEIYGYYASKGADGTETNGGTGLKVYGGSGRKTSTANKGNGGVGLIVYGGTAGDFTGPTADAGHGGTGLVVYGGAAGKAGVGGYSTPYPGNAIQTYGAVVVGDTGGNYQTKISSISTGLKIDNHTTISGGANIDYLTLSTNASLVTVSLTAEDISAGLSARKKITSGGIISGVGEKTGFTLDQNVPVGTIFIVTGGKGTNRYFSNNNGWQPLSGGIYRVANNEDYGYEKDLYCICSPYVEQGWVGREEYG